MLDTPELKQAFEHHLNGRFAEAERLYRQIVASNPDAPEPLHLLGALALQLRQIQPAIELTRRAIAINPNVANYHNTLGLALLEMGQRDEAANALRTAIRLNPALAEAQLNLGIALQGLGQIDEAAAALHEARKLRPDDPAVSDHLAYALRAAGRIDEAIAVLRGIIALRPGAVEPHSHLLYAVGLDPACEAQTWLHEHREWAQRHAAPLTRIARAHEIDRDPNRRLRIGYVSPEFHQSVLAQFLLPILKNHDREQFEVFCYSNARELTEPQDHPIRALADHWRNILSTGDELADQLIRADRIDILIDLSLHAAGNRLLLFARRPAPVQISYLSYPGTTGMDAISYRVTDPYLDPVEDAGEWQYAEQPLRLPQTYWCYSPAQPQLEVDPVPSMSRNGVVTFGCLNLLGKLSLPALEAFARILGLVSGSRLMLYAPEGSARQRIADLMAQRGIDPGCVSFAARQNVEDYLRQYQNIDISLDSFPYAGGATTCDALWMGVPVITLAGQIPMHR